MSDASRASFFVGARKRPYRAAPVFLDSSLSSQAINLVHVSFVFFVLFIVSVGVSIAPSLISPRVVLVFPRVVFSFCFLPCFLRVFLNVFVFSLAFFMFFLVIFVFSIGFLVFSLLVLCVLPCFLGVLPCVISVLPYGICVLHSGWGRDNDWIDWRKKCTSRMDMRGFRLRPDEREKLENTSKEGKEPRKRARLTTQSR